MNIFSLTVADSFHFNKETSPGANATLLVGGLQDFVKSTYPSSYQKTANGIVINNKAFRFKVNRARNFFKGFNQFEIWVEEESGRINVHYKGSLLRGVFIAAFQTILAFSVLITMAPNAWWIALIVAGLSYTGNVITSRIVVKQAVGKELHKIVFDENS